MEYLNFDIRIDMYSQEQQAYPVIVNSPTGETDHPMRFPEMPGPLNPGRMRARLERFHEALKRLRQSPHRTLLSEDEQTVQDFGLYLFEALLSGQVLGRYRASIQAATDCGQGLRLRLRIRAPELVALPWEFLYDRSRGDYVCLFGDISLVRYTELEERIQPLEVQNPLRILGMVASPDGLARLNIAHEQELIQEALRLLEEQGLVRLRWVEGQTLRDLDAFLEKDSWHVFHFIGHGGFELQRDQGYIVLANEQGTEHRVDATTLARHLDRRPGQGPVRLVLLNTCEGARGGTQDILSSTASILARRGIPAIVAMQYEITDSAAVEFARTFYEKLAQGMSIDTAVTKARLALSSYLPRPALEWGTPVLYMRSPDGILFRLMLIPPPINQPVWVKLWSLVLAAFSFSFAISWPRRRTIKPVPLGTLLLLVILLVKIVPPIFSPSSPTSACSLTTTASLSVGGGSISTGKALTDPTVGISDGQKIFDVNRDNQKEVREKRLAAQALISGDRAGALSHFGTAGDLDPADAEAQIYLADQNILADGNPYFTIVVGTAFIPGYDGGMRDILQGAFLAQQTCNKDTSPSAPHCFLLIANAGSSAPSVGNVAQQIIQYVKQYDIVGVMGWPLTTYTQDANGILAPAGIPMVSPTASSKDLTSLSLFRRVVPSDTQQVKIAADYLQQHQKKKGVVLFISNSLYTVSLKELFLKDFGSSSLQAIDYTGLSSEQLLAAVAADQPDFVYFCGYVTDILPLLTAWPTSGPLAHVQIMGADALSVFSNYPNPNLFPGAGRLSFTAFAFYQEWEKLGFAMQKPPFFKDYQQTFDPYHASSRIGSAFPDGDAMLSYDAMQVVLYGVQNVLSQGQMALTSMNLWNELKHLPPIQGVSGKIAFGTDADPTNKEVLVLSVDAHGIPQFVNGQPDSLRK